MFQIEDHKQIIERICKDLRVKRLDLVGSASKEDFEPGREELLMSEQEKQILAKALKLPPTKRAEIGEQLLSSFEFPSRKEIDALWAKEAENRIDAFERGEITTIPAKEVFEKIEKRRK